MNREFDTSHPKRSKLYEKARARIAKRVRELRQARRWTQAELAARLHLSQSRLSEIEAGHGSFTAEQFLAILRLFNVPASDFVGRSPDREGEIQNTLARLGAFGLVENAEIVPAEKFEAPADVVREILLTAPPRLITGLAPVLVSNLERIALNKLYLEVFELGYENRLGWLLENIVSAIRHELTASSLPPLWIRLYRRAETILSSLLDSILAARNARPERPVLPDVLDHGIRSRRTLEDVSEASSSISRRWHVVTSLQPEDFATALRAARAGT